MKKIIFLVFDDSIKILEIKKVFKTIKIYNTHKIYLSNNESDNILELGNIIEKYNLKKCKIDIIFSSDSILTRIIETPKVAKDVLEKYINNNIEEYFALNIDSFYYDYKIIKEKKSDGNNVYSVLIAAIPKEIVNRIINIITGNYLTINIIDIYPNCLSQILSNPKKSIALLDSEENKSNFIIIDKEEIFVYTIINTDYSTEIGLKELIESINYFLNFYASRNYGAKIDEFYFFGEYCENARVNEYIRNNIDVIRIANTSNLQLPIQYVNEITPNTNISIIGLLNKKRKFLKKDLNFNTTKKNNTFNTFSISIIVIIIVSLIFSSLFIYYKLSLINNLKTKYNTTQLEEEIKELEYFQDKLEKLKKDKELYDTKIDIINDIYTDVIDYNLIMETLYTGLPKDITINQIEIDKKNVKLTLNINNSTLEVADVTIALNNMGLFKHIEVKDVVLDDNVSSFTGELEISDEGENNG